jgi:hypothetical protein
MVFFQVFMAVKHHLPHLIPVRRESAPKQQQIVLLPGPQKACGAGQKTPAGCYRTLKKVNQTSPF